MDKSVSIRVIFCNILCQIISTCTVVQYQSAPHRLYLCVTLYFGTCIDWSRVERVQQYQGYLLSAHLPVYKNIWSSDHIMNNIDNICKPFKLGNTKQVFRTQWYATHIVLVIPFGICSCRTCFNLLRPSDAYMRKHNIVDSDNGLWPGHCQAIIWTNGGILLTEPPWTKLIHVHAGKNVFEIIVCKMSSISSHVQCVNLDVRCPYKRSWKIVIKVPTRISWRYWR